MNVRFIIFEVLSLWGKYIKLACLINENPRILIKYFFLVDHLTRHFRKFQSSHSQMFYKEGVLKTLAKFTGKYLRWVVFSCEFCDILKALFIENLRIAASGKYLTLNFRHYYLLYNDIDWMTTATRKARWQLH